jgi:hypothetical protein
MPINCKGINASRADYLSIICNHDDWGISDVIFELVESLWGPHEVDWFASDHNPPIKSIIY